MQHRNAQHDVDWVTVKGDTPVGVICHGHALVVSEALPQCLDVGLACLGHLDFRAHGKDMVREHALPSTDLEHAALFLTVEYSDHRPPDRPEHATSYAAVGDVRRFFHGITPERVAQ
jgi:hypothetical protein